MWIIVTVFQILIQTLQLVLDLIWWLIRVLARLIGLSGWKKVTTGEEYEEFAAEYLKKQGFRILEHPGGSGDLGVDLVVQKGLKTYAVQCKYYSGTVDGSAIQQVVAGMPCYSCNAAMVITNSTLTPGAWTLAEQNGVEVFSEICPVDDPGALSLERLLSPARLAGIGIGLLLTLLALMKVGPAGVRENPVPCLFLAAGCFLAAGLMVWAVKALLALVFGPAEEEENIK